MKTWAISFYNSDIWRTCRDAYMQSAYHLCERCSTDDDPVIAKVVHHKVYLTPKNITDPYVALSWENLEALCQECHNREHHAETEKRYAFAADGSLQISPPMPRNNCGGNHTERGG